MKINKKTIIIIVIVVAVVAYLVWKKRRDSADIEAPASTSTSMSVKSILASIGASSAVKSYVNQVVKRINASATWKEDIAAKAEAEEISFNQEAVLNALYVMYEDKDQEGNRKLSWSEFDRLASKVRDL